MVRLSFSAFLDRLGARGTSHIPPTSHLSTAGYPNQIIQHTKQILDKMLDLEDFIEERGGNPQKIKESQRRRGASVELVDEIIALWQEARTGKDD